MIGFIKTKVISSNKDKVEVDIMGSGKLSVSVPLSKISVEDFLRHICLLTDKRMPTIRIPNTVALLAGQTNGYINRFIGRDTWFTASSLRTLWSNSGISSVLAEKALKFTSRPWQSSITDQLDDLYRSF